LTIDDMFLCRSKCGFQGSKTFSDLEIKIRKMRESNMN
jgi:hypothetical protein